MTDSHMLKDCKLNIILSSTILCKVIFIFNKIRIWICFHQQPRKKNLTAFFVFVLYYSLKRKKTRFRVRNQELKRPSIGTINTCINHLDIQVVNNKSARIKLQHMYMHKYIYYLFADCPMMMIMLNYSYKWERSYTFWEMILCVYYSFNIYHYPIV